MFLGIGAENFQLFLQYHNPTYCVMVPLISSFGMIGNFISIFILARKPFRTNILFAYLQCLSIVDFMFLLITCILASLGHFIRYLDSTKRNRP